MSETSDDKLSTHSPAHGGHAAAHEHAHIAKFGAIKTSGFVPNANEVSDEDVSACARAGIHVRPEDLKREEIEAEARRIHGSRRYLFRKVSLFALIDYEAWH